MKRVTLMEMMRKLPNKKKEIMEMDERRLKRLDLQEVKQSIWRKWRERKVRDDEK